MTNDNDIKDLVAAMGSIAPDSRFRLRQGVIQSVAADGTVTVTIGGSTTSVSGIAVASHTCPIPGASCWLATDGRDWIVQATLAPTGPAWATMRQNAAQSIATGSFVAMNWTTRTETASAGMTLDNAGFIVVVPGLYQVNFAATFAANATGQRHAMIYHNGTVEVHGYSTNAVAGSDVCRMNVSTVVKCAIGDTINGVIYQSSGAALNTTIGAGHNILRATWVGPAA